MLTALPNVIWDAQHYWDNLSMDRSLSQKVGGPLGALAQLPQLPLLLAGLLLIGLWWIGARYLRSAQGRGDRWVLTVAIVAVVLFTLGGGKPYYAAPAVIGLFAAGAVGADVARPQALRLSCAYLSAPPSPQSAAQCASAAKSPSSSPHAGSIGSSSAGAG